MIVCFADDCRRVVTGLVFLQWAYSSDEQGVVGLGSSIFSAFKSRPAVAESPHSECCRQLFDRFLPFTTVHLYGMSSAALTSILGAIVFHQFNLAILCVELFHLIDRGMCL